MTGLAIASMATMAVGAGLSAYSSYQQGKEAEREAKAQAEIQRLQADAYSQQAADLERQARREEAKAGIAQIQAEQEAEKRSRLLAADIGSAYANFAGNGLLVDGGKNDTVGSVLTTTAAEASRDISTIKDNGRMNVWELQSNAQSLLTSAGTSRLSAEASLLGSKSSLKSGKYARRAGITSAIGSLVSGGASIGMGAAGYFK